MTILFFHGWQSVPGGFKPSHLKDHGHTVINPKLPDEDFPEAVRIAQAEFDKHQPRVVVGSSRGGAVAMNTNGGSARLVLLCPAWKRWGTVKTVKPGTVILHSRADDVIPFADSEELVRNRGLPAFTLIEVGQDHRLADPEPLEMLLDACTADPDGDEDYVLEHDWAGLCYSAVLRWVSAVEHRDWVVVHGTVWSDILGKRIEHAWCERDNMVIDLALPAGSRIIDRDCYYRSAKPEISRVYTSDDALLLSLKNRHHGPWAEDEHLKS